MGFPRQSAFNLPQSTAATTPSDGDFYREGEELKPNLEGAAQKLVILRHPGAHPGLNQLRNPSFEVDADAVKPPTGWTDDSGATAEVDTAEYYDGAKSVKIPSTAAGNKRIYQAVAVKKGQKVTVSCAVKTSTADNAKIAIQVGAFPITYSSFHTGGGTWEILSVATWEVTADGNATIALLGAQAVVPGDAWFDQAMLTVTIESHIRLHAVDSALDHSVGSVADGAFVKRSGASFVGDGAKDFHNYRRTATWYPAGLTTGTTLTATAFANDVLCALPWISPKASTLEGLAMRGMAGGGSIPANVRMGIYEDDGNLYPGALLLDAGSAALAGGDEVITITGLAQALAANKLYWLVIIGDAGMSGRNVCAHDTGGLAPILGWADTIGSTAYQVAWTKAQAYGALPDPFPAAGTYVNGAFIALFARLSA